MSDRFKEFTPVERVLMYQLFADSVGKHDLRIGKIIDALCEECWPVAEQVEVVLTDAGERFIAVIKAVRGSIPGLGLKEAKEYVDCVRNGGTQRLLVCDRNTANIIRTNVETEGGTVVIR